MKDKIIAFKATEDEHMFLIKISQQLDLSLTEYLRSFVFKQAEKDKNKWDIDLALETAGKPVTINGKRIK